VVMTVVKGVESLFYRRTFYPLDKNSQRFSRDWWS
jgi:hypothetical protein